MAVITILLVPRVRDAVTFQDTSGQVRVALWTGTLNLIEHHPIAGSALGQFPYAYEHYRLPSHVELLQYPHNLFLDFWVELGVLGFIWIIGVLLYAIVILIRMRDHAHIQSTTTAAAFYLCALIVYGIVDVTYFKNDLSLLFWVMLTLVYSIARTNTKRVRTH
jgi:O-antigen ligase